MRALVLEIKKVESDDNAKYYTFCSNSKAETIINESDIDDVFESICQAYMSSLKVYVKLKKIFRKSLTLDY